MPKSETSRLPSKLPHMKKSLTFLAVPALFFSFVTYGQKAVFGFTAGATLANLHVKEGSSNYSPDSKVGVTAGVLADIPIADNFNFQPAINYVQKGAKTDEPDFNYESKLTVHYVEIPLNFLFKPEMTNMQLFVGAGPSIAFALSGKEKENDNGVRSTYKFKFGDDPDEHDMRRADIGANFIAGIETKTGFIAAVNYNLGLSNLVPGGSDDGSVKNRYLGLRIGYLLKGGK